SNPRPSCGTPLRLGCQAPARLDAELSIDLSEVVRDGLRLDFELSCDLVGSPSPPGEIGDHDLRRSEALTLGEHHRPRLARDHPGESPGLLAAATVARSRASQRAPSASRRAACGRSW